MKGILLAGGHGTRLYPLTRAISKQLLPVYDKPLVYYALSTLLRCGIREILIISTPRDEILFRQLLGDGSQLGCVFRYKVQEKPKGLPEAFLIGEEFIEEDDVALILGDNIFHGARLEEQLQACTHPIGSTILAYHVEDPRPYGVVTFDKKGKVTDIVEKPTNPRSKYIVPGLYFYNQEVIDAAKMLRPSARGELEITDIHNYFLKRDQLTVQQLHRGTAWLDAGTFSSLIDASQYVRTIEERQGFKVGCIEEIAFRMGYIDEKQLEQLASQQLKSGYGAYLLSLLSL